MSLKRRLVRFSCVVLEAGVLFGVPMRPEQIRELMQKMNKPKIARAGPSRPLTATSPMRTTLVRAKMFAGGANVSV